MTGFCPVCGVRCELELCRASSWGGRWICARCHGSKRLSYPCPCMTIAEATVRADPERAAAAAKEAHAKLAAILK